MQPATERQQAYLDRAAYYVGRALICYGKEMWPEAATHFGSALESLLRIRFGQKGNLARLVERFDEDSLFDGIYLPMERLRSALHALLTTLERYGMQFTPTAGNKLPRKTWTLREC